MQFLVGGLAKAEIVARLIKSPSDPNLLPVQIVQPKSRQLVWLLDVPAASLVDKVAVEARP